MLLLMMTIVDDVYDGVVDADDDDYGHHSQRFSPCDPLLCHPRRYEEDDDDSYYLSSTHII